LISLTSYHEIKSGPVLGGQDNVNQSTGVPSSSALTTNTYYNHRGQVIEVSNPGGLVEKMQYDGAGRQTEDYQTDGAGGTSWTAAGSVASDNVLQQTDTSYDAASNVIEVTTRQRFDNETTLGALGNPTTAPKARVSYIANYYDAANRETATVDVGTNGGSTWTRPGTVPARSDAVLVTSYGHAADNVQLVQLTGSPTGGTFTLSFNGQTTAAIAYNASAATVQSDLQALTSIGSGNALVAGGTSSGPWTIRFAGSMAGSVEPAITANGTNLIGGGITAAVTSLGGDAGRQAQMTDPRGIIEKTDTDWLGRTVRTVEAFSAFSLRLHSKCTAPRVFAVCDNPQSEHGRSLQLGTNHEYLLQPSRLILRGHQSRRPGGENAVRRGRTTD
jgi:YD repeat-containing protein